VDVPADDRPERGNPDDIPKVASDWPNFNFIIYHACLGPALFYSPEPLQQLLSHSPPLREGVPDIRWTTRFAVLARPFSNVFAEIGSTFASTVITFPTIWAHLIGQLLKFMGSERIVFGSDSVWYGSPQWQIEAFWRFNIPEKLRKQWDYPRLTHDDKRNILGLNSARLYDVPTSVRAYNPVPSDYASRIPDNLKKLLEFPGFTGDNLSRIKRRYLAEGPVPEHTRYGWIRAAI
jgi:predicted TIM-barrel fold metal-dependent hydrolase